LKNEIVSKGSIDNLQPINGGEMTNKSGSVMVVGAGIAGMQAALDLANSDYKVYLVDKSPTVGGMMSRLDKTFPTNDCAM
jgi:heterodisulfide reductase subunit A